MYKYLILTHFIWMAVSQAVFCQGERFSFLSESDLITPLNGKYGSLPATPDMIKIEDNYIGSFQIARTEVTVYQYRKFCAETNNSMPTRMPSWGWRENHPIVYVTHNEAKEYCKWLSAKTGVQYRLPTVKQWELAAKGGYVQHQSENQITAASIAWYNETPSEIGTSTVATKISNHSGVHDMQGNVSEWCEVESKKQVRQPIKGGSWNRCKDALSVSDTEFIHTETRSYSIGFRPVAESE